MPSLSFFFSSSSSSFAFPSFLLASSSMHPFSCFSSLVLPFIFEYVLRLSQRVIEIKARSEEMLRKQEKRRRRRDGGKMHQEVQAREE
jgi:hypothetical protein